MVENVKPKTKTFTTLDLILVTFAGFMIFTLLAFTVFGVLFQAFYSDYGIKELPMATRFVTRAYGPPLMAFIPGAIFAYGLFSKETRLRKAMIGSLVASFIILGISLTLALSPILNAAPK